MSKIYIGAGHGGKDPGAVSGSREEKTYNLAIANKVASLLKQAGHDVLQNRTSDVDSDINDKAAQANKWGADLCFDIHLNAGGGTGTEAYYQHNNAKSKAFATAVSKALSTAFGWRNRGAKIKTYKDGGKTLDYFGMVRLPKCPAVLIEVCFIDSAADMAKLDTDKAAKVIADTVLELYPAPAKDTDKAVKVGDTVTLNGYLYADSYGGSKGRKYSGYKAKVTRIVDTNRTAPYLLDNGLGWARAADIGASAAKTTAIKKGDTVYFDGGYHYPSSNASAPTGGVRRAGQAKVTYLAKGAKYPYHLVGKYVHGWVAANKVRQI